MIFKYNFLKILSEFKSKIERELQNEEETRRRKNKEVLNSLEKELDNEKRNKEQLLLEEKSKLALKAASESGEKDREIKVIAI